MPCRSSPTMKRIGGTAAMPAVSTSQPARRSTSSRAAAMHVNCAIVAPVANPDLAARREPEQVDEPLARELLDGDGGRA